MHDVNSRDSTIVLRKVATCHTWFNRKCLVIHYLSYQQPILATVIGIEIDIDCIGWCMLKRFSFAGLAHLYFMDKGSLNANCKGAPPAVGCASRVHRLVKPC
jgi:hypothetical protein